VQHGTVKSEKLVLHN